MQAIEYFYSAHSAFAYLGSSRLRAIAADSGREIKHKPMDLDAVVAAGGAGEFGQRSRAHVAYYFGREIDRWSEEREAPVLGRIPTHHANDTSLANGLLIAAMEAGHNIDALSHTLLQAHWRDDADLADAATLAALTEAQGLDAPTLLGSATSDTVKAIYAANTAEAIERSVFGSPSYFVDGDLFYGQDRLEMVERALRKPYR